MEKKSDMESSEHNKDISGMNRRKKFIQFPELVDPKSNEKTLLQI